MTAPTLNSLSLGNVLSLTCNKNANLSPIPRSAKNSHQQVVYDANGAQKTFSVTGKFSATTVAAVKVLIDAIDALLDGDQTAKIAFVSDLTGTKYVFVNNFSWTWDISASEYCADYSLELVEGIAPNEVS